MWKAQWTKKSRQPKRQKSLELVQSRQSLTTVRRGVPPVTSDTTIRQEEVIQSSSSFSGFMLRLGSYSM